MPAKFYQMQQVASAAILGVITLQQSAVWSVLLGDLSVKGLLPSSFDNL